MISLWDLWKASDWLTFIIGIGTLIFSYYKLHKHTDLQQKELIDTKVDHLMEKMMTRNDTLTERIDVLELRLDNCLERLRNENKRNDGMD